MMMISNNIKKATVNFPAIQGMGGPSYVGRIKLKNVYEKWKGENFYEIVSNAEGNPFNLRLGMLSMDEQMKKDNIFLFTKYLAYNPLTKQIEKRELIPLRNVEKIYIGQSPEEHTIPDYKLFVNGNVVLEDVIFKNPNEDVGSLIEAIKNLQKRVLDLEEKMKKNTTKQNKSPIYK